MADIKLTYLDDILAMDRTLVPDIDNMCLTRDFKDTKRFSPVIYNKNEMQPNKDSPDYQAWWHEQYRRCVKGYIVPNATKRGYDIWIPGRMYFYLNFWVILAKLDNVKRKDKRHPKFTSLDYFKFMCIELMFLNAKDLLFPKSRQKGFSEYAASNIGYNFIFIPGSQNVIVAGQGNYAEHTMSNVVRGLDWLGDSEFYKRRSPNRNDYIKSSYREEVINEETGEKRTLMLGFGSEVYCITAKDNTQAVSGLTPFWILYEEIGKWKKDTLKQTAEFVKPSLLAEGDKTGYQMYIGTGGDMDESVADVEEMAYNPAKFDLLEFDNIWEEDEISSTGKVAAFVPAYEFEIIDEDGNSLIEESIVSIQKELSSKNSSERYIALTAKPLYLSQMFMVATGGFLGETANQKLNDRKRYLLTHREQQIAYNAEINWIDPFDWGKGVELVPSELGRFLIIQAPEVDGYGKVWKNLYSAATDSYDKVESETSFSLGSCSIWKGAIDSHHTFDHWVARVTERPTEDEGGNYQFYEDSIKLCYLYGECENLIEYSNVLIFDYYKRAGCEFLLQERPQMVISQYVQDGKAAQRYGVEQSFIPHALNIWRDKMKQDDFAIIDKMFDIRQIEAFAKFKKSPKYNCDITIASALNVASALETQEFAAYSEGEELEEDTYGGYVSENNQNIKFAS